MVQVPDKGFKAAVIKNVLMNNCQEIPEKMKESAKKLKQNQNEKFRNEELQ